MKVEFRTGKYEWVHGHSPRGYGFWGFDVEGTEIWKCGTYTDAKKACVEEIRNNLPKDYKTYAKTVVVTVLS